MKSASRWAKGFTGTSGTAIYPKMPKRRGPAPEPALSRLKVLHAELDGCTACPNMIRPVVHGPAVLSKVMLIGQAPGPREGSFGRPFAWTAGKTLFRWFEESLGVDEETFRARVYIAAVARCFPGKAKGGGKRKKRGLVVALKTRQEDARIQAHGGAGSA